MSDNGEALEAFVNFKADDGQLSSTIETSLGKINKLTPAAHGAESSINKVWATKSGAAGLNNSLQQTARELDNIKSHAHGAEGGLHGMLASLKGSLGRRSTLGEVSELLRGAGAIAGAAALVEAFKGVAHAIVEVHQQSDRTFNGMALAIANNVPILKDFSEGVHELMAEFVDTGGGKTLNDRKRELQANQAVLNYVRDGAVSVNDVSERGTAKTIREANEQTGKIQSKQKIETDTTAIGKRIDEVNSSYQEQLEQFNVKVKAEFAKRSLEHDKARGEVYAAYPGQANKEERDDKLATIDSTYKSREAQIKAAQERTRAAMTAEHDSMLGLINTGAEALRSIKNATELIGLSELKAAEKAYRQQGYGADTVADLVAAKGKEIGAHLHQALLSPMEQYQKEVDNLKELRQAGDISEQDFQRAQYKNAHDMLASTKSNSVEGMFLENLKNRFIDSGINSQVDDLNKQLRGGQGLPTIDDDHKLSVDWQVGGSPAEATKDNTDAVTDNTTAQQNALAAMKDLGRALQAGINATFGQ